MGDLLTLAFAIGAAAFPFVAMPLLWRRMKKTQRIVREQEEVTAVAVPWQETVETRDGLIVAHEHRPNAELLDLGQRSRQSHWPLNNP